MLFDSRTILNHVILVLAAVPALTNAAGLSNATSLAGASSQDLPRPTCYSGSFVGDCYQFIDKYCDDISEATSQFHPGDTEHRCYSALKTSKNTKYKCVLGARNTNANADDTPIAYQCKDVLHNLVKTCKQGGHGKYTSNGAFAYEIDNQTGNSGVCRTFASPP